MSENVELLELIKAKVITVISNNLRTPEEKISPQSSFVNDLNADSLDQVELVMAAEEEFGCEIQEHQAEKFVTVQHLIDYLVEEAKAGNCKKINVK
jgi:acyl carrier protein